MLRQAQPFKKEFNEKKKKITQSTQQINSLLDRSLPTFFCPLDDKSKTLSNEKSRIAEDKKRWKEDAKKALSDAETSHNCSSLDSHLKKQQRKIQGQTSYIQEKEKAEAALLTHKKKFDASLKKARKHNETRSILAGECELPNGARYHGCQGTASTLFHKAHQSYTKDDVTTATQFVTDTIQRIDQCIAAKKK